MHDTLSQTNDSTDTLVSVTIGERLPTMVKDMTSLTTQEAIAQVAPIIGDLGSKFMLDKATMDAATELGYGHPFALYFLGRGGVLGNVDADVIVAAFAFFEPGMVRTMWDMARQTADADTAVKQYAQLCAQYGDAHLAGVSGLERFNELAEKVIDAVDVTGLSLFAGWRKVPRPTSPAARAYHNIHVMREWRGSAHICAVAAASMSPQQAIVTGAGNVDAGVATAQAFGWAGDCGDVSGLAKTRDAVEQNTSAMQVAAYSVLSPSELQEFVDLVKAIQAGHTA